MKSPTLKILRDPIFRIALVGCVALLAMATLFPRSDSNGRRINVDRAAIERLTDQWEAQYGTRPSLAQTRILIENHIENEIAYREALRLELYRGDALIRQRLIQNLRILNESLTPLPEPSQDELENFYRENPSRYTAPQTTSFQHIYFDPVERPTTARKDANAMRIRLTGKPAADEEWRDAGDPFVSQREYTRLNEREVAELFGDVFATTLRAAPPGPWAGPIPSTHGWHAVRVLERPAPGLQPLSQISQRVREDWMETERGKASRALERKRRAGYEVHIEEQAAPLSRPTPPDDRS